MCVCVCVCKEMGGAWTMTRGAKRRLRLTAIVPHADQAAAVVGAHGRPAAVSRGQGARGAAEDCRRQVERRFGCVHCGVLSLACFILFIFIVCYYCLLLLLLLFAIIIIIVVDFFIFIYFYFYF